MFKILVLSFCAFVCNAAPTSYGGLGQLDGLDGYGGNGGGPGGYGGRLALSNGGNWNGAHVTGAVQSHRSIQLIPVHSNYGSSEATIIDIPSSVQPVVMNFNSQSSPLDTTQNHHGQPGSQQDSHSVDEPHVLRHEVTRPVVQEIRELIVPSRNVVQEIQPVVENVQTLVARGEGRGIGGGLDGGLGLSGNGCGGLGGNGCGGTIIVKGDGRGIGGDGLGVIGGDIRGQLLNEGYGLTSDLGGQKGDVVLAYDTIGMENMYGKLKAIY